MKKILFSLFMLSLLSSSVIAQQPMQKSGDNNRNKEMRNTPKQDMKKSNKKCCMSVAEATKLQTEQLKTVLQLSDEQTRKVYAILLLRKSKRQYYEHASRKNAQRPNGPAYDTSRSHKKTSHTPTTSCNGCYAGIYFGKRNIMQYDFSMRSESKKANGKQTRIIIKKTIVNLLRGKIQTRNNSTSPYFACNFSKSSSVFRAAFL